MCHLFKHFLYIPQKNSNSHKTFLGIMKNYKCWVVKRNGKKIRNSYDAVSDIISDVELVAYRYGQLQVAFFWPYFQNTVTYLDLLVVHTTVTALSLFMCRLLCWHYIRLCLKTTLLNSQNERIAFLTVLQNELYIWSNLIQHLYAIKPAFDAAVRNHFNKCIASNAHILVDYK